MKILITVIFFINCLGLSAQKGFERTELLLPITSYKLPSPLPSPQPQPSSYMFRQYVNPHPGFFCKMEYKIEVKSKLSPRFRLGSVNYTNWMEGKGEWYSRYWK